MYSTKAAAWLNNTECLVYAGNGEFSCHSLVLQSFGKELELLLVDL
jgi:hypothetical protein